MISASADFSTGTLSPVSADSSTDIDSEERSLASAGILSPVLKISISPATASLFAIVIVSPPRTTFTTISSPILLNASNAFWLLPSITTLMHTERAMAKNTPAHSKKSASPPVTLRYMLTPRAIRPAAMSIKIIGSVALEIILFKRESPFCFVSTFDLYFSRFSVTCSALNPFSLSLPKKFKTSSLLLVNITASVAPNKKRMACAIRIKKDCKYGNAYLSLVI
ncbi:unknown [Acidaminococcus sp. CAG:917]|nr:unknown [Acidaminococcus sp. CAG:917]